MPCGESLLFHGDWHASPSPRLEAGATAQACFFPSLTQNRLAYKMLSQSAMIPKRWHRFPTLGAGTTVGATQPFADENAFNQAGSCVVLGARFLMAKPALARFTFSGQIHHVFVTAQWIDRLWAADTMDILISSFRVRPVRRAATMPRRHRERQE